MNSDFGKWVTARSLDAAPAEGAGAPADSAAFVSVAAASTPRVEIRLRGGALGGAPASVTLGVWRLSGGSVDKLGTFVIAAADIGTPIPTLFEIYDPKVFVTVESFSGGTAPTLTATIEARAVFGG